MKKDGNGAASPALGRIESHAKGITNEHHAEIDRTDCEEQRTEVAPWPREKAVTSREIDAYLQKDGNDYQLTCEKRRVGDDAGKPLFPGRQEGRVAKADSRLAGDPQDEEREKAPEHTRRVRAVSHCLNHDVTTA
jgi:hypothetical protein